MEHIFVQATLHQLEVAVKSMYKILDTLQEEEIDIQPIDTRRSLREVLAHTCVADFCLMNEATEEEMTMFYEQNNPRTLVEMKSMLQENMNYVVFLFQSYTEKELTDNTTSYWGVSYSRYEWLVEIVAHFYHHRGQAHQMITEHIRDVRVQLFE
ncbi:DinB family protein [Priestia taiwanensis]|uniref:DinB family protein n=1 Tax=Priestia taiwanensis TaxID=1347902 RepID=A0A917AKG8_9BACI|nr:DinB family protein [Priestia taiwanensis]MBM7361645.1 putative damage-inducible protein DinB [Priestia taiwanensis]GGE55807.1 hypothetical protein GCM10007140_02690 [Priestia taiwanensis]